MRLATVIFTLAIATACGGKSPGAYQLSAAPDVVKADVLVQAATTVADLAFDARVDGDKLAESLALYEAVLGLDPNNRHALERLTRGWYFYGDAYTNDKAVKLERWTKSIEYGKRCIALNQTIATRINAGEKERDAVTDAVAEDVPCLYFTASALGKWGKAQSLSKTLKHIPTIKAYMSSVETLNPSYFYHGPARYWGAYYSALPSFAGRDLEISLTNFQASIDSSPGYLGTRVLRAEYNYVVSQNVDGYLEDLYAVLAADPTATPDLIAENTREQEKAKRLVDTAGEFFTKEDLAAALEKNPTPNFDNE